MTYAQYGLIQASDYNAFTGPSSTVATSANQLNTVYGVGNGNSGYGQTVLPTVTLGQLVSYTNWRDLINVYTSIGNHQSTAITAVTVPSQGALIQVLSSISTNLTSIYTNRLNASGQAATYSNTVTNATTWSSAITFTHTVTFSSADAARYFFNAGGQLALTFSHPAGTAINNLWNSLATACGTVVISSPISGSITVAGTSYNGITKIGGSGTTSVLSTNTGYYGLTTTAVEVFKQLSSGSTPAGYSNSFISVSARSNGTQGSNGDKGTIITITVTFDEVPNGSPTQIAAANTSSTVTVRPPATSYLTNTWGTVSVTGSVSGS